MTVPGLVDRTLAADAAADRFATSSGRAATTRARGGAAPARRRAGRGDPVADDDLAELVDDAGRQRSLATSIAR